jgi:hypothetical protein
LPTDDELNDPNDFELFLLGSEGTGRPPRDERADKDHASSSEIGRAFAGRGPSSEVGFIR